MNMQANRVIVEVVNSTGTVPCWEYDLDAPQTLAEVHSDLWQRVGRMPVACYLSAGTARVIFQSGRRATDTLDNLEDCVRLALGEKA